MKNKKLDFLINQFKLSKEEVDKVNEVCKLIKSDKYIVWVAKEFKKNPSIIDDVQNLIFIFDWVKKENINVLNYDFQGLIEGSKKWHKENFQILQLEDNRKKTREQGIVYECEDGEHFFKILSPGDLDDEGKLMGNCISGYKEKLIKEQSIIISLRDKKNLPHVDIEIDTRTCKSLQVLGKGNDPPIEKYQLLILEYAFNALGVSKEVDEEIKNILLKKDEYSQPYKK
jgi:hypothetical protein